MELVEFNVVRHLKVLKDLDLGRQGRGGLVGPVQMVLEAMMKLKCISKLMLKF
jgi:hypothetical protein